MSKSAKSGTSGSGGSLIAGILLGMILGLAAAGGVAWYMLKKNPASFENKDRRETPKAEVENKTPHTSVHTAAPAPTSAATNSPAAASEVNATPQHFEFYKVLTDKPDGTAPKGSEKSGAKEPRAAAQLNKAGTKEIYYVQAGSFPSEDDAEKLKAKLAILGLEPSVQTAVIPDRGTYHRVRLGPFNNSNDMNKVMTLLKQNGVANATSIKVQ